LLLSSALQFSAGILPSLSLVLFAGSVVMLKRKCC
jgi:hypothetical protein